jgi:hypothetical protein
MFMKQFKMKDLNNLSYLLGMKITRNRELRTLTIDHVSYLKELLSKFNLSLCKPRSTPAEISAKLGEEEEKQGKEDGGKKEEVSEVIKQLFSTGVGALSYVSLSTRPDISYMVNVLSRFMSFPTHAAFVGLKHLLRYISGSVSLQLTYTATAPPLPSAPAPQSNSFKSTGTDSATTGSSIYPPSSSCFPSMNITCYCDASWGNCPDKRSVTGYCIKLNNDTISWACQRQATISLSTMEAEFYSITAAIQEIMYLSNLLRELRVPIGKVVLYSDNQAAIALSEHDTNHRRSKHISMRKFFIREKIEQGIVQIKWIPTYNMIADIFTKNVSKNILIKMRNIIFNQKNNQEDDYEIEQEKKQLQLKEMK